MVAEAHRLGRKVLAHARGREATLYSAQAGVDLIYHAFELDDECIEHMVRNHCVIGPTLTLIRNWIDFTRPSDGSFAHRKDIDTEADYARWCRNLARARLAGVPMVTGTDSGFAVTPYGEWHARELELFVTGIGFTPGEALIASTSLAAPFLSSGDHLGSLQVGKHADFIAVSGNPLVDISVLQDKRKITDVYLAGKRVQFEDTDYDPRKVSDFSMTHWNDLYTRERVAQLAAQQKKLALH